MTKLKDVELEIVPYDGTPNPRNPYDRLTHEERQRKIVELYAKICLRMLGKKAESSYMTEENLKESP